MLKKNDLIDYFYKGIKDKNDLRIGVEHEKFVLNKNSVTISLLTRTIIDTPLLNR